MEKNTHSGKFIVIEGLDGSGNTTQASLLVKRLKKFGIKTHLTKEPTDSLIGGLIRSRLKGDWSCTPDCLQLLFSADRAYHLEKDIVPLLKKGIFVVSDRYFLSTLAYGALALDVDWLKCLNEQFLLPDAMFLIRASPKICVERIEKDRTSLELFEKIYELGRVWGHYEKLAGEFPDVLIIDGEKNIDTVSETIFSEVEKRFLNK